MVSLLLTLALGTIDMIISIKTYETTGVEQVVFTLMDAVIFTLLTIVLTFCTI